MLRATTARAARRSASGAMDPQRLQLFVRVQPGSARTDLVLERADDDGDGHRSLSARVTARAHDGAANDAVRRLIAERLGVARSRITIVRGEKSRDKVVAVDGMSAEDVVSVMGTGDSG